MLGALADPRFQRFFALDAKDSSIPADRSVRYTVVEVLMMAGRPVAAKKAFCAHFHADVAALGVEPVDLEITVLEAPRTPGDPRPTR